MNKKVKAEALDSVSNLSVRFKLRCTQMADVLAIGGWFFGLPKRDRKTTGPVASDVSPAQPAWLESCFKMAKGESAEAARDFLKGYGKFDEKLPLRVGLIVHASHHPLMPSEVREQLRQAVDSQATGIYLWREADFWDEWRLLESLAEIVSQISSGTNPILLASKVDRANAVLDRLREADALIDLRSFSTSINPADVKGRIESTKRMNAQRISDRFGERLGKGLAGENRKKMLLLINNAFRRGLGNPVTYFDADERGAPRFVQGARSIRAYAYLSLLHTFSHRWQRCERPDCGNLFVVKGRKAKFCSWYCGHIEAVRRGRRKVSTRRGRVRSVKRPARIGPQTK